MITAISPPTEGDTWIQGKDLTSHSRQIKAPYIVPQLDNLDEDLAFIQNLTTVACYFDIVKDDAKHQSIKVLNLFELNSKLNSWIRELSGGMKRRLLLVRGSINMPQIPVFDEPSISLDPQT